MPVRPLTAINAAGCLVLAGLLALQWKHELDLRGVINAKDRELHTVAEELAKEQSHSFSLQRDLDVLKDSLEATAEAARENAGILERRTETIETLKSDVAEAREQIAAWEQAVKERDKRIATLDDELKATRQRLAEAIEKLKRAGAR